MSKKSSSNHSLATNIVSSDAKKPLSSPKSTVQLLSGCVSGLITCFLFQPFDLIKTRQQQKSSQSPSLSISSSVNSVQEISKNRQSLTALINQIFKQDGLFGFWRGTVPTILRNVPGMGLYFLTFENLKLGVSHFKSTAPTRTESLVCGSSARALVGLVLMPISVIKVRVESNIYPEDTNARKALRSILNTQGFKGLFAGSGATILRDAPYAGLYIYFYQLGKSILITDPTGSPSLLTNMAAGIGAGFTATLLTHPFDVAKTRMQLDRVAYPNVLITMRSLMGPELSRGLTMRLARKSLSSAISWAGYEQLVYWATILLQSQ